MVSKFDEKWLDNFKSLVGYINKYNRLPEKGIKSSVGTDLFGWLGYQRQYFRGNTLETWKIEMFEKYAKGALEKSPMEFNDSLMCCKPVNIPKKEYDITVTELFNKGIISNSEYVKFVKNKHFYFSEIIGINGSRADLFISGIRVIRSIPDYKWCAFYCLLFGCKSPESVYLDDKGKFINHYCEEFEKLESKYFSVIVPKAVRLTDRERLALDSYFGLSRKRMSILDIAEMYGISKGRAWEVLQRALRKVRYSISKNEFFKDKKDKVQGNDLVGNENEDYSFYTCPLVNIELSVRTYNCLIRAGIGSLGELHEFLVKNYNGVSIKYGLSLIRNMGVKGREEICNVVHKYGLTNKVFSLD